MQTFTVLAYCETDWNKYDGWLEVGSATVEKAPLIALETPDVEFEAGPFIFDAFHPNSTPRFVTSTNLFVNL